MTFKNMEIHNAAELFYNSDGSISWCRVPLSVFEKIESEQGKKMAKRSTGVELRFVLKSESVKIKMSAAEGGGDLMHSFHVYRGSVQGEWEDHEVQKFVGTEPREFEIKKSSNIENLKIMTENSNYAFSPEVIRVIFDRGAYKIYDVIGDIELPEKMQCPRKTLFSYGSSITHGSNSIDLSHSWVSLLAHNLRMDARNLGMAGSCFLEKEIADYIADEGKKGKWDILTLELGINAVLWEEDKIKERSEYFIKTIAESNPEKPIFVISPFYYCGDSFDKNHPADRWRRILNETVKKLGFLNVTYFNGLDILDNMKYMSADQVHPNIYGVQKIADTLTEKITKHLKGRI